MSGQRTHESSEGALVLRKVDGKEWEFVYQRLTDAALDELDEGIRLMHDGRFAEADGTFRRLAERFPEFIDAHHHLAMLLDMQGRSFEALQVWQEAVEQGLRCMPFEFTHGKDTLPWLCLDNRPFLRAYHGLGLAYLARGSYGSALDVFLRVLALNPNDNQGARVPVIHCYFRLKRPEDVLAVCAQCPDDMMEQVLYGKPLALFQVVRLEEARDALGQAIQALPLVAKEVVKSRHRRPKQAMTGYVTHGGADQAYEYWRTDGCFWSETPGAIEFVRKYLDEHSS